MYVSVSFVSHDSAVNRVINTVTTHSDMYSAVHDDNEIDSEAMSRTADRDTTNTKQSSVAIL